MSSNKRKIINDPVHGFVNIPSDFIFDVIEHPIFQRLRRIKQLGLTHFVYPGATHSRFQHTIGALYLMNMAIDSLRGKGIEISDSEEEAAQLAILLHDIGHGPFSHALEESLISGVHHEFVSKLLMSRLNQEFSNKLDLAIAIFNDAYPKKFLHQLVSSQLDVDRLDYIKRDSFYTGVTEGTIGTDRILKMLHVHNGELVVEKKGIYSVEKFLIARRLMYWQVYLHKTVIAAEKLLVQMLKRAKTLAEQGERLFCTPSLSYFLYGKITADNIAENLDETLLHFISLDDTDILASAKEWQHQSDTILQTLATQIVNRKLPKVQISDQPFPKETVKQIGLNIMQQYGLTEGDLGYMLMSGAIYNNAFGSADKMVQILTGSGKVEDLSKISDILNVTYLHKDEKKFFICYPRNCGV